MIDLSRWKAQTRNLIDNPWEGDSNHPDCPNCGYEMNYCDSCDSEIRIGCWECPVCGINITEDELV